MPTSHDKQPCLLLVQFIVHILLPLVVVGCIGQRTAAEAACHLNVERIETLFLVERAHLLHLFLCQAHLLHGVDILLYVAMVCGTGDNRMSLNRSADVVPIHGRAHHHHVCFPHLLQHLVKLVAV